MAVIRVEKTNNYTVMSNHHLRNKELSLKAKGLMSFMLSLPDEWDYSEMGLVSCLKENRSAIRAALKELETLGYLVRGQERLANGKMGGAVYTVYENPLSENRTSEKRMSEKRMSENHTQIKTKVIKKDKVSTDERNTKAHKGPKVDCSPALAEALTDFEEHRKKLRKPMTEKAKSLLLSKLSKLGRTDEEKIAILNQSIENGWQGVFPLGGDRGGGRKSWKEKSVTEQVDQLMQEMEEEGYFNDQRGTESNNADIDSLSAWVP